MVGRFGPPLLAFSRNCRAEGIEAHLLDVGGQPVTAHKLSSALTGATAMPGSLVGTEEGIDRVRSQIDRIGADAVIGLSERHLLWLRRNAERFEPACKLLAPSLECLTTLASKEAQIAIAREAGFPILATCHLRQPADAAAIPDDAFPVCIRPSNPIGIEPELKAKVFHDRESLHRFLTGLARFEQLILAQPYHHAPDLKVHGARSESGEILAMECFLVPRKFEGVTLTLRRMPFPPGIEAACRRFADLAGLTGAFHFDLLFAGGTTYYLEVNARMGGVTDKALRLGYNQPATILRAFGLAGRGTPLARSRREGPVVNKKSVLKHLVAAARGRLVELDYPNVGRLQHIALSLRDLVLASDSVFDWADLRGTLWFYSR